MRFIGLKLFLVIIATLYLPSALAACGDRFERLDNNCVLSNLGDAQEIKFLVPKDSKKIKGNTYFYRTESGMPGKFIVRSSLNNSKECSISLSAISYLKTGAYSPSASFRIVNEFNVWTKDRAGFDYTSTNDFELYRDNKGRCIFQSVGASARFYKKIEGEKLIKGRDILAQAGLFLIFLAVFLVARAVFQDEDRFKAQSQLEDAENEDKKTVQDDLVLKYSRPFFSRYVTPAVKNMKGKKKIREKYKRKLATAGLTKSLTPEDFFAFKLFLILGFPIVFFGLREFLEESWPLELVPIMAVIGFKYPDIWINGKIDQRKNELVENLPFVIDMLALSVEAGLDFMAAIVKVIEKAPPSALTDEFEILVKETKVGASRAEGLRQLSWRTDCLPIASFSATLIAADQVGASIGPILKTLSAELRVKRSSEAEKKGATAATKILFPMLFLIMPAVGIIIMAPIMMQFIGN